VSARLLSSALIAWLWLTAAAAETPASDDPKRGEYLALAGDCAACHTLDPAKPFAGGYPITTPAGVVYAPNITPDKETGIGSWTDGEFVRTMHEGIGKRGEHLYPAFPYDSYTLLSREDVLAIKAYLFSLKPIRQETPPNRLSFPFNQRWILAGWKLFNFYEGRFKPDPTRGADWNSGAYLVEALEHCGACHTPRNLTLGEDARRQFAGGDIGGWYAYNITSDATSGVGAWCDDELVRYLSTGSVAGKAAAAGGMAEAIDHSLSRLPARDIKAIVAYLRSVPPIHDPGDDRARFDRGAPARDDVALRGAQGISAANEASGGAELYSGNCASCHGVGGAGSVDGSYPSLLHESTVGSDNPNNLIMVMLNGVRRDAGKGEILMPGFAKRLRDDQIAALSNYIFTQFGDPNVAVTAEQVAQFRQGEAPPSIVKALPVAMALAGLVALALAIAFVVHLGRRRRAAIV
jgi:mono/diheme cytochrome c family protein